MGRKAKITTTRPDIVLTTMPEASTPPAAPPAIIERAAQPGEKKNPLNGNRLRAEWSDFVYLFASLLAMIVLTYTHNYELGLTVLFAGAFAQLLALVARS